MKKPIELKIALWSGSALMFLILQVICLMLIDIYFQPFSYHTIEAILDVIMKIGQFIGVFWFVSMAVIIYKQETSK